MNKKIIELRDQLNTIWSKEKTTKEDMLEMNEILAKLREYGDSDYYICILPAPKHKKKMNIVLKSKKI